jgi:RES domain-containing protein
MGLRRIRTAKLLDPGLNHDFEGLFLEELDSAFTAGIACCENCYDDFVKEWPAIYLHDIEFQCRGIDVMNFYENSEFADEFEKEEFKQKLEDQVKCPRCGISLTGLFWPYNLPFDPPEGFTQNAKEIAALANQTPFLVLTHPLAKKVYEEIARVGSDIFADAELIRLYRARPAAGLVNPTATDLGPPQASETADGRFNHAGLPALYLATTPELAFAEVGSPESGAYIATVELLRPPRLLNVSDDLVNSDVVRAVFASALVSAPPQGQGWAKPEYLFSRFVADCARAHGLDGIKYPSARKAIGANVVIFGRDADWSSVYRVTATNLFNSSEGRREIPGRSFDIAP